MNGFPLQLPTAGVTVYTAVPVDELVFILFSVWLIEGCGVVCTLPPIIPFDVTGASQVYIVPCGALGGVMLKALPLHIDVV